MGGRGTLLMILALAVPAGRGQVNNNRPVQVDRFYLDSNADCNGPVRELYGQQATVFGHGAIQDQQPPQSCTLKLKSTSNFDHTNLHVSVIAASIRDCNVRLTVYDGDPGQGTLQGYDCNTPVMPNQQDLLTTGDVVSFILERRDAADINYDIQIKVSPLVSGKEPGYENDYGDTWGFFREKLENDAVVGIVGAIYLLTVILVVLGVILCYRRYKGVNKPWEQHQLSTFRPPASIYETKSKMSDTSSGVWASSMSRGKVEPPQRRRVQPTSRMARASEDEDSVFDDASDVPPKKYLVDQDRRWERERERERDRHRGRGRGFASQNTSYVQADDDHPQDTFVERIIEPRVRPGQLRKPPSYDEAINETETEKSDLEEEEDDDSVDKKGTTSEEESEQTSSEEEEEEEEEEDGNVAAPKPSPRPRTQPPPPPNAMPLQPGMQPHPAYARYPPPVGYMGGYPVAPGQFVPVVAAPPAQFPPVPAAGPGHPPPRYPGQHPSGNVRPTDPPIYSYLVQRGYTPLEAGRDSPVSQANTSKGSLDDSDKNILASGVEYMRR